MKCPLFIMNKSENTDCLESDCAWFHMFDIGEGQCSLLSLAQDTENIKKHIIEIAEALQPEEPNKRR